MRTLLRLSGLALLFACSVPCLALISVGHLSKPEATELGITMKHRPNGDAGVMVWLEFRKQGFLEKFTYAEFRMNDAQGKHVVSARLQPQAIKQDQAEDVIAVAFSAEPAHLEKCAFMLVAYRSSRGDAGYVLNVKDFLDLSKLNQ